MFALKDIYQSIVFHIPKKSTTIPASSLVRSAFDRGCRCIFFGEDHHEPPVLAAQCSILYHMSVLTKQRGEPLYLVMEAFNVEQQPHLDAYTRREISPEALMEEYSKSEEGFDLLHYLPLIDLAREGGVQVRAGFPPRPVAHRAVGGEKDVWEEAKSKGWVNQWNEGTPTHFQWFKSLFTGMEWTPPSTFSRPSPGSDAGKQEIDTSKPEEDDSRAKRIFPAQVFKDSVLGARVEQALATHPAARVMAVCGRGHSDWWLGAPERVGEPVCVLSVRSRMQEYEDEEGRVKVHERTVDEVVLALDERMCDGVFIY